jgi:hypothetical protein
MMMIGGDYAVEHQAFRIACSAANLASDSVSLSIVVSVLWTTPQTELAKTRFGVNAARHFPEARS